MSYVQSVGANRRTWLAECDPRLKLTWLATVSLTSVLVDSRTALFVLCAAAFVVAAAAGWSARTWLTVGTALALVTWGTILSQAMFYMGEPRTPIITLAPSFTVGSYSFPGLALYQEGTAYGLIQSAHMVAVMLAGLTVCLTTSPERLLAALAWLRVPAAISFMTVAALRFLPTFIDEWTTVRRSRQFAAIVPGCGNLGTACSPRGGAKSRCWSPSWLRRCSAREPWPRPSRRAVSMPRGRDTIYPKISMTPFERLVATVLWTSSAGLAAVKSLYWLSVSGTVRIPALESWYDFARDWL